MKSLRELGSRLRTVRGVFGMKQEDLAGYLGVSRELVSHYETGARSIPLVVVQKIADLYGISVADLLEMNLDALKMHARLVRFRAASMNDEDRRQLAAFNRIVRNYAKMRRMSIGE